MEHMGRGEPAEPEVPDPAPSGRATRARRGRISACTTPTSYAVAGGAPRSSAPRQSSGADGRSSEPTELRGRAAFSAAANDAGRDPRGGARAPPPPGPSPRCANRRGTLRPRRRSSGGPARGDRRDGMAVAASRSQACRAAARYLGARGERLPRRDPPDDRPPAPRRRPRRSAREDPGVAPHGDGDRRLRRTHPASDPRRSRG